MSVLSEVTQVEQRALLAAAEKAHIGRVYMIEEGSAAAIGAGVPADDVHAAAVVDIGGAHDQRGRDRQWLDRQRAGRANWHLRHRRRDHGFCAASSRTDHRRAHGGTVEARAGIRH